MSATQTVKRVCHPVRLPESASRKLRVYAAVTGKTINDFIAEAVETELLRLDHALRGEPSPP